MSITTLRRDYHQRICQEIIRWQRDGEILYPNLADKGNESSQVIAKQLVERFDWHLGDTPVSDQLAEQLFVKATRDFLEAAFVLLRHLRPGDWYYSTQAPISDFDQYEHLADLERIVRRNSELASVLGQDYIITPDIVIGRWPVSDDEINREEVVLEAETPYASFTSLRQVNAQPVRPILHASISCKWTIRSDRVQNSRAEALNLIRNRKGHLPHIVAVTAEPLPTRIASLALGTGDLDCVYHFALPELQAAISEIGNEDQLDMLTMLIEGRRLRDISDLVFDLAV